MRTLNDWNGKDVILAESRGGVLAFVDPYDGLISKSIPVWPPPEVLQKLYRSRQERAFSGNDLDAVTSKLGYYSDLQSMHSEDAVTWNAFGPLKSASNQDRCLFVNSLAESIGVPSNSKEVGISLWRRVPHPDTLVSGGPEIDFTIITDDLVILGEAKWRSSVGIAQGKNRDKDQIQLRHEFFTKYGSGYFGPNRSFVVLGASLGAPIVEPGDLSENDVEVKLRDMSWSQIAALPGLPHGEELERHISWRKQYTRGV